MFVNLEICHPYNVKNQPVSKLCQCIMYSCRDFRVCCYNPCNQQSSTNHKRSYWHCVDKSLNLDCIEKCTLDKHNQEPSPDNVCNAKSVSRTDDSCKPRKPPPEKLTSVYTGFPKPYSRNKRKLVKKGNKKPKKIKYDEKNINTEDEDKHKPVNLGCSALSIKCSSLGNETSSKGFCCTRATQIDSEFWTSKCNKSEKTEDDEPNLTKQSTQPFSSDLWNSELPSYECSKPENDPSTCEKWANTEENSEKINYCSCNNSRKNENDRLKQDLEHSLSEDWKNGVTRAHVETRSICSTSCKSKCNFSNAAEENWKIHASYKELAEGLLLVAGISPRDKIDRVCCDCSVLQSVEHSLCKDRAAGRSDLEESQRFNKLHSTNGKRNCISSSQKRITTPTEPEKTRCNCNCLAKKQQAEEKTGSISSNSERKKRDPTLSNSRDSSFEDWALRMLSKAEKCIRSKDPPKLVTCKSCVRSNSEDVQNKKYATRSLSLDKIGCNCSSPKISEIMSSTWQSSEYSKEVAEQQTQEKAGCVCGILGRKNKDRTLRTSRESSFEEWALRILSKAERFRIEDSSALVPCIPSVGANSDSSQNNEYAAILPPLDKTGCKCGSLKIDEMSLNWLSSEYSPYKKQATRQPLLEKRGCCSSSKVDEIDCSDLQNAEDSSFKDWTPSETSNRFEDPSASAPCKPSVGPNSESFQNYEYAVTSPPLDKTGCNCGDPKISQMLPLNLLSSEYSPYKKQASIQPSLEKRGCSCSSLTVENGRSGLQTSFAVELPDTEKMASGIEDLPEINVPCKLNDNKNSSHHKRSGIRNLMPEKTTCGCTGENDSIPVNLQDCELSVCEKWVEKLSLAEEAKPPMEESQLVKMPNELKMNLKVNINISDELSSHEDWDTGLLSTLTTEYIIEDHNNSVLPNLASFSYDNCARGLLSPEESRMVVGESAELEPYNEYPEQSFVQPPSQLSWDETEQSNLGENEYDEVLPRHSSETARYNNRTTRYRSPQRMESVIKKSVYQISYKPNVKQDSSVEKKPDISVIQVPVKRDILEKKVDKYVKPIPAKINPGVIERKLDKFVKKIGPNKPPLSSPSKLTSKRRRFSVTEYAKHKGSVVPYKLFKVSLITDFIFFKFIAFELPCF